MLLSKPKPMQLLHPQKVLKTPTKQWATTAQASTPSRKLLTPSRMERIPTDAQKLLHDAMKQMQLPQLRYQLLFPSLPRFRLRSHQDLVLYKVFLRHDPLEKTLGLQQFTCFDLFSVSFSTRAWANSCPRRGHTFSTRIPVCMSRAMRD